MYLIAHLNVSVAWVPLICAGFVSFRLRLMTQYASVYLFLPPDALSQSKMWAGDSLAGVTVECVCCCFSFIQRFLFHPEDAQRQTSSKWWKQWRADSTECHILLQRCCSSGKGKMLMFWQVKCGCTVSFWQNGPLKATSLHYWPWNSKPSDRSWFDGGRSRSVRLHVHVYCRYPSRQASPLVGSRKENHK